jgi:DNA primase
VGQYDNPSRQSAYKGRVLLRMQRFSDGATVGYLARDIRTEEERGDAPKYAMPTGLHKSLEVFGAWQLKEKAPHRIVYVVESPFAVMRFHEMGLPAVSPYGWSVSEQQAGIVGQLAKGAVCLPDADKRDAFEQSAFLLARRMWVRCPAMPEGVTDPEELNREQVLAFTA